MNRGDTSAARARDTNLFSARRAQVIFALLVWHDLVHTLQRIAELDPATAMVVGAECRNILHRALGHTFALRATTDLDIGIAIADWNLHNRLTRLLTPIGYTGIRYLVDGVPVGIMPFGDVERPREVVTPTARAIVL